MLSKISDKLPKLKITDAKVPALNVIQNAS